MTETERMLAQYDQVMHGIAWHGDPIWQILEGISAQHAVHRPLADVHSIWELLLHVQAWDRAGLIRLNGKACQMKGVKNFPPVIAPGDGAWRETVAQVKATHDELVEVVAGLPESRLREQVPGKRYDFYHMLHGIAQHELYHAGQIALLKKMQGKVRSQR